jgi:hypothetical protein
MIYFLNNTGVYFIPVLVLKITQLQNKNLSQTKNSYIFFMTALYIVCTYFLLKYFKISHSLMNEN